MKQTATLLIIDISKVYTMDEALHGIHDTLSHAFIAVFHDEIVALGEGSYDDLIDKDTRILNGAGCIAIPGIIDGCFAAKPLLSPYLFESHLDPDCYYEQHFTELVRDLHSLLYQMLQNGITTFAYPTLPHIYEQALQQLSHHPYEFVKAPTKQNAAVWNCGYDTISYPCFDPFYQMRIIKAEKNLSELDIIDGFTRRAALYIKKDKLGSIGVHQQADILLIEGSSIEYVFHQLAGVRLRSVIKRGTQQFPNILI